MWIFKMGGATHLRALGVVEREGGEQREGNVRTPHAVDPLPKRLNDCQPSSTLQPIQHLSSHLLQLPLLPLRLQDPPATPHLVPIAIRPLQPPPPLPSLLALPKLERRSCMQHASIIKDDAVPRLKLHLVPIPRVGAHLREQP